jgi:hypothetical protein
VAAAKTLSLSLLRQTLNSRLLRTLIEEKKTSPLSRKASQDTEQKKKHMSSAKFYTKHPTEKRTPPKKKQQQQQIRTKQTSHRRVANPFPSLPRRIQFPLLNTQIGERELHRWLVGFPERRRTPWDAAGRHCMREKRGIDKAKTKRSTEREQQQLKRRRRRRKARHQKPIAGSVRQTTTTTAARPPAGHRLQ